MLRFLHQPGRTCIHVTSACTGMPSGTTSLSLCSCCLSTAHKHICTAYWKQLHTQASMMYRGQDLGEQITTIWIQVHKCVSLIATLLVCTYTQGTNDLSLPSTTRNPQEHNEPSTTPTPTENSLLQIYSRSNQYTNATAHNNYTTIKARKY